MVDSLERVLSEVQELYAQIEHPKAKPTHELVMATAHGWYTLISRSITVMTHTENESFQDCFAPVRRSAMEHVAALYWLAEHGDSTGGAIDSHNFGQSGKLVEAVKMAKWKQEPWASEPPGIDEDNLAHYLRKAKDRILKYGGGLGSDPDVRTRNAKNMYVAYLSDTFHSHPSWRSASPYVTDGGDRAILESVPQDTQPDPVHVGVMLLLPATDALNSCLMGEPWTQRVIDLDARAHALLRRRS